MTEHASIPSDQSADHLFRGNSHPGLAIAAFCAPFLFTALPFLFGTDNFFLVGACVIAALSSTILFMRLLIGDLGLAKWFLLATACYMTFAVGSEWYIVVFLTVGTLLCSLVIDRIIGEFVPLVRGSKC